MKAAPFQISILSFALQPGKDVLLFPTGVHGARDGRGPWKLTDERGPAIAAQMNDTAKKVEMVIDYEHQTFLSDENGQPAPAAGWAKSFEYRPGQGLYALGVDWTAKAEGYLESREYRYFSPVVESKDGYVTSILQGALTNFPALLSLGEIVQRAQLRYHPQDQSTEDLEMNELLTAIIAACKLPTTATEKDAVAAFTKLKGEADSAAALVTANAVLKEKAEKVPGLEQEIVTLKAGAIDPTKYAPVAVVDELRTQVATLTAKMNGGDVESLVQEGLKAGKLTPAMADWARDIGKKDIAQLKTFIEKQPAIAALTSTQTNGKPPVAKEGEDGLTEAERTICKNTGVSAADFLKTKSAQKAA